MKPLIYLIASFVILFTGCTRIPNEIRVQKSNIKIIIWDPEEYLELQPELINKLYVDFPDTHIINEVLADNTISIIKSEFDKLTPESCCIFILISGRGSFHVSTLWNLWMPELWRGLDCRAKILIADAPWGDEYLNPLKTMKKDSDWVINGKLGHLRRKLPASMLAASCRFDESNMISRGIDGETKTPLFSWYFLESLNNKASSWDSESDLTVLIENAAEQTATARTRGVVSDLETTLFFNNSEIEKEEFPSFPNPIIWNGLAEHVIITERL